MVVVVAVLFGGSLVQKANTSQMTYNAFLTKLSDKQVANATVDQSSGIITGTLTNGTKYSVNGPNPVIDSEQTALKPLGVNGKFVTSTQNPLVSLLYYLIPFAIILGIFYFISRRAQGQMGSIMSIGRSKAKLYSTERPSTTFDDVAGYDGVKLEISEVVDFLKTPARFKEIGARIPKGILLVGPPGTGKTLLARAVAGEAGVPFMSVSGSDFMEMFVGVGASRVRDLFATARKQAPAIVFIDEIDSIGRKRGAGLGGGHDEREQTLNQMLSEMDGFDPTEGIVVMAATNRPDILDAAILRPGRFDRQIVVPLPDLDERLPILQVHCKDKRMAPDVDLRTVARGTPGMSGADLANLVNEAALHAVRQGKDAIRMVDFEAARDRVLMGQRRIDGPLRQGEGSDRLPRRGSRRPRLRPARRRPGPQGDHPADRHGSRRHPAAPDRGAPHLLAGVHRGRPVRDDGRALRRATGGRQPVDGCQQRLAEGHGDGSQDGAGVRHERADRAHGMGSGRRRVPR
jgi:cell division protease FtsH